jgi:hypothetical protein
MSSVAGTDEIKVLKNMPAFQPPSALQMTFFEGFRHLMTHNTAIHRIQISD